jgi:hypothetical protein
MPLYTEYKFRLLILTSTISIKDCLSISEVKDFIENNIGWIRDDKFGHAQELLGFDPKLDEHYKQCTATNQQNTINSSKKIIGLMRDVIENGKSDEALSQIQKQEIKQYILSDQRYFKETFDFLMDSRFP